VRRLALLPLLLLADCGATATADHRLTLVATTPVVADLAGNVGGPDVHVVQMLAANADPSVEHAVARATGATVGPALGADALGPIGSDGATYLKAIASNTRALVDGFAGHRVACEF
jgi:ABC-type Zn uptake system ZnuABC Zn-binding protein ZnuA